MREIDIIDDRSRRKHVSLTNKELRKQEARREYKTNPDNAKFYLDRLGAKYEEKNGELITIVFPWLDGDTPS